MLSLNSWQRNVQSTNKCETTTQPISRDLVFPSFHVSLAKYFNTFIFLSLQSVESSDAEATAASKRSTGSPFRHVALQSQSHVRAGVVPVCTCSCTSCRRLSGVGHPPGGTSEMAGDLKVNILTALCLSSVRPRACVCTCVHAHPFASRAVTSQRAVTA